RGSTTMTRWLTPTCGAARPTPSSAYMVSNMSRTSVRISSVTRSPATALARRTGSPTNRITSCTYLRRFSRGLRQLARDLGAYDDDAGVLARAERHAIVVDVNDRADDAAIRDDLIVALQ